MFNISDGATGIRANYLASDPFAGRRGCINIRILFYPAASKLCNILPSNARQACGCGAQQRQKARRGRDPARRPVRLRNQIITSERVVNIKPSQTQRRSTRRVCADVSAEEHLERTKATANSASSHVAGRAAAGGNVPLLI
ncbi:Hypothetical predicted protein [Scomber scombrus]|uniref:Uncharacterized protein n=1 Tax=Scomber scombrus TaxID=13677 RepID=A0AAV1Q387_SCOSC